MFQTKFKSYVQALRYFLIANWMEVRSRPAQEVFREIYNKRLWCSSESASGVGSELSATGNVRKLLADVFKRYDVKRVVDLACGDFNWQSHLDLRELESYLGLDIVPEVINSNAERYTDNNLIFEIGDLSCCRFDKCDLVILRDVLIHLDHQYILKAFCNLENSDFEYILVSTTKDRYWSNKNKVTGGFALVNLFSHPFNLDPSLVLESVVDGDRREGMHKEIVLMPRHALESVWLRNVPLISTQ